MNKTFHFLLTFLLILALFGGQSFAKNKKSKEESSKPQYQCKLISRASAINQAKRRTNGKVVGVQLDQKGNRSIYRVRVLVDKKRVKTVSIQACR